jgi:hypothetical protein
MRRATRGFNWLVHIALAMFMFLVKNPRAIPETFHWLKENFRYANQRMGNKSSLSSRKDAVNIDLREAKFRFENTYFDLNKIQYRDIPVRLQKSGFRRWGILYGFLRLHGTKTIVETGVAEGQSTAHILQALLDNGGGILHSIDLPNQFYLTDQREFHAEFNLPGSEPGCLVPAELRKFWELSIGPSQKLLPFVLKKLGMIDVFFHDSEHTSAVMDFEFETAWPYIRTGGYLVTDDASWSTSLRKIANKYGLTPVIVEGPDFSLGFLKKESPF